MNFTIPPYDLWEYLQNTSKTVVLYGMGNGADKILAVCQRYDIPIGDFFASDGFVRGHAFHGKTVLSYSAVKEKYGAENIIVLLSFGSSLPSVLDTIRQVASECELYAPDVPVCGDTLFTRDFYLAHKEEFSRAADLLADEESICIFQHTLNYKISGRIDELFLAESKKETVYTELLNAKNITCAMDLGAYNGDTVRELLTYAPSLHTVYAMEPDRRNFRKLDDYANTVTDTLTIHRVQAAAWKENTVLTFGAEGNRNSGVCAKGQEAKVVSVEALAPDRFLNGANVDYIKYDVEGAEAEALAGSIETIRRCRPSLLVSAYHRSEDMYALLLQIHEICPEYRLYLRRYPYVPAWDLNIIATK